MSEWTYLRMLWWHRWREGKLRERYECWRIHCQTLSTTQKNTAGNVSPKSDRRFPIISPRNWFSKQKGKDKGNAERKYSLQTRLSEGMRPQWKMTSGMCMLHCHNTGCEKHKFKWTQTPPLRSAALEPTSFLTLSWNASQLFYCRCYWHNDQSHPSHLAVNYKPTFFQCWQQSLLVDIIELGVSCGVPRTRTGHGGK